MQQHLKRGHLFPKGFPKNFLKLPLGIKVISLFVFTYFIGWSFVLPFKQIFYNSIVQSYTVIGIANAFICFIPLIWTVYLGELLDTVSKKKILVIIMVLFLPLGFIMPNLKSTLGVILFSIYNGITSSLIWGTVETYIRSRSPKRMAAASFGFLDTSFITAAIIGCVVSGFFYLNFGNKVFYVITITGALALLIALFFLPKNEKKTRIKYAIKKISKKNYYKEGIKLFFENPKIIQYSILDFLLNLTHASIIILLSLFLAEITDNPIIIGIVYALYYVPQLSEIFTSTLADKKGKNMMINFGLILGCISFFGLFLTRNITSIAVLAFLVGIAFSSIFPALGGVTTNLMQKKHIGLLTGVFRSIKLIACGIGPIIGGIISDVFGTNYFFLMCTVVFVISFIFFKKIIIKPLPIDQQIIKNH